MPISDCISKLLELEDIILNDLQTTNTEVHISFSLKRRPHICPSCGSITDKVHDYRHSIIRDLPFMDKKLFFTIVNDVITVLVVRSTFMKTFLFFLSIVVSLQDLLFIPYIYLAKDKVFAQWQNFLVYLTLLFFVE